MFKLDLVGEIVQGLMCLHYKYTETHVTGTVSDGNKDVNTNKIPPNLVISSKNEK